MVDRVQKFDKARSQIAIKEQETEFETLDGTMNQ
jgi:hypothetical protein